MTMYSLEFDMYSIGWLLDNQLHRTNDLPAVERFDGTKVWYQYNQRHRITGPAVTRTDGEIFYWLNGHHLTQDQWQQHVHTSSA